MVMMIETYEVGEIAEQDSEECAEARALVVSLRLVGQARFVARDTVGVVPYREMTREEHFVFAELCPESTRAESYSRGPIPVRVLRVLEHARSLGFFRADRFEVWCPASSAKKDPVLVAYAPQEGENAQYRFMDRRFLLARWGDDLEPLSVLATRAVERCRVRLKTAWTKIAATAQMMLVSCEDLDPAKGPREDPRLDGMDPR